MILHGFETRALVGTADFGAKTRGTRMVERRCGLTVPRPKLGCGKFDNDDIEVYPAQGHGRSQPTALLDFLEEALWAFLENSGIFFELRQSLARKYSPAQYSQFDVVPTLRVLVVS